MGSLGMSERAPCFRLPEWFAAMCRTAKCGAPNQSRTIVALTSN